MTRPIIVLLLMIVCGTMTNGWHRPFGFERYLVKMWNRLGDLNTRPAELNKNLLFRDLVRRQNLLKGNMRKMKREEEMVARQVDMSNVWQNLSSKLKGNLNKVNKEEEGMMVNQQVDLADSWQKLMSQNRNALQRLSKRSPSLRNARTHLSIAI